MGYNSISAALIDYPWLSTIRDWNVCVYYEHPKRSGIYFRRFILWRDRTARIWEDVQTLTELGQLSSLTLAFRTLSDKNPDIRFNLPGQLDHTLSRSRYVCANKCIVLVPKDFDTFSGNLKQEVQGQKPADDIFQLIEGCGEIAKGFEQLIECSDSSACSQSLIWQLKQLEVANRRLLYGFNTKPLGEIKNGARYLRLFFDGAIQKATKVVRDQIGDLNSSSTRSIKARGFAMKRTQTKVSKYCGCWRDLQSISRILLSPLIRSKLLKD